MRAIPRFLAPSILKSSQRGKFAPEPLKVIIQKNKYTKIRPIKIGGIFGRKGTYNL